MFQRDFMLRQMEEWSRFLATIIGLRVEGDQDQAESAWMDLWSQVVKDGPGPDKPMVDLLAYLEEKGPQDSGYLIFLGQMLWEKFQLSLEKNPGIPEKTRDLGCKSCAILIKGLLADETVYRPSEISKVQSMERFLLRSGEIPALLTELLSEFRRKFG